VSLSYLPTKDLNFYVAYKTGYKSGGIDNSALPSNALLGLSSPDPAVKAATAASLIYKSETAEGGEIGVKSQWFDRTLTLNASIYDYIFKNLQLQIFDGVAIQFRTTNAGELTSRGADLDFKWLPPIQGLSFYGALAYTDATYTKTFIPDPVSGADLKGRASSGAPKWAGNVAANYQAPVFGQYEFDLTGNVQFKTSYYTRDGSPADYVQGASATFDLASSIGPADGHWALALIGTNLADKRTVTSSGPRPFLPATGDDVILNLSEGRKVFIQASFKF
jgi:iron complex outermembrane receptor protein